MPVLQHYPVLLQPCFYRHIISSRNLSLKSANIISATRDFCSSQTSGESSHESSGPNPTPKKRGFVKILGFAAVTGLSIGGAVLYYDDNAKDFVHKYIPLDVLQSSKKNKSLSYIPFLGGDRKSQLTPISEEKPTASHVVRHADVEEKPVKLAKNVERRIVTLKKDDDTQAKDKQLSDIVNVSKTTEDAVSKAVKAQIELETVTRRYASVLRTALDSDDDRDCWKAVSETKAAKDAAQKSCELLQNLASTKLQTLSKQLDTLKKNNLADNGVYEGTAKVYKSMRRDLSNVNAAVEKAAAEANVLAEYQNIVERGREDFRRECQELLPADKQGPGAQLSEQDLNLLIAHAHTRIMALRKQLAEFQSSERERLQHLLHEQETSHTRSADARVRQELELQKMDSEDSRSKLESSLRARMEQELRAQLTRQAAAHTDHIQQMTRVLRDQLTKQFDLDLRASLAREREDFQTALKGWTARVHGVETAVEGRAHMLSVSQRAQQLWLACHALRTSVEKGGSRSLAANIDSIRKAAHGLDQDSFVTTVANSLPAVALTKGVSSEDELRYRFRKVQRVCSRVAMIPATGASIWRHLVSYAQSWFIFYRGARIIGPEEELEKTSDLDAFSLLRSAESALGHGDLECAVRLMNQLPGMARLVAHDWIREARSHLEIRQAARALCSLAAARGLDAATQYRLPLSDIENSQPQVDETQPGWM